ncbi:hypothetical protein AB4455_01085 [Vibrio sp. 10N.261.46.E12]|uniref:hypothetical protein n=1 Tax=unclassified Vibrio TaxID=2614977 RepID=UPI0012FFDFD3|nr:MULTISPECIES: hypothetical protein [unclassified Vibrio]
MKNIYKLAILVVALSFKAYATMPLSNPMPIDLEHLLEIQRQAYGLCLDDVQRGVKNR